MAIYFPCYWNMRHGIFQVFWDQLLSIMKKIILLSLLAAGCVGTTHAQHSRSSFYDTPYDSRNSGSFNLSTGILSFGYGFPNTPVGGYNNGANGVNRVSFGPLYAKFEHGIIRDEIGLGGQLAMSNSWVRYNSNSGNYRDRVSAFSIAILGYYHFNKLIPVKRLDVYVGTGLSLRTISYTYDTNYSDNPNNHSDTNVYVVGKLGARYYLTPAFGFYAEVGSDKMSDANLGISFRL